ncbi:MAG TPA: hypothetical protein D7H94_01140 [Candidatus Poseidoniales archaeon]|nr:MAG TPA: hypothetical protein D7H94_01140 [Candidatus Poseidoniales archaeon]
MDDVISTGGTMEPVLSALIDMGVELAGVWTIFEKDQGMQNLIDKHAWPLSSLVRIEMVDGVVNVLPSI